MKRKPTIIIGICWILLLALSACEGKTPWAETEGEKGSLVLKIATRALTPGDGNASDGGAMNDLLVLLVNNDQGANNKVQGLVRLSDLASSTRQVVSFDNIALGSYSIYVFGNYNGNSLFTGTAFASLEEGDNFNAADASFASLSGAGSTPDAMFRSSDGAMLLTARQDIEIKLGNNTTSIEMLRPLVHFIVELNNHSNHKMMVDQSKLSFSNFNASTSYVVAHDGMNTGSYRSLPAKNAEVEIPSHDKAVVYECYLYENQASAYNFGMKLNMWTDDTQSFAGYTISYTRNGTTYYLYNDNGTPRTRTSYHENCLWDIVPTGDNNTYYLMSDVGSSPYLCIQKSGSRYNTIMYTNSSNSNYMIKLQLPGYKADTKFSSTIGHATWRRYVYADNNGNLSASSTSRTWEINPVVQGSGPGYQEIASFTNRQLIKVDAVSGKKSPLSEMRRNSQVKVTLNAYFNELNGEFNYAVETWDTCTNNIEFN
ncbi:MAG: hypothetical protein J6R95_00180 [Bacteroidales bacterium]|nr:hypothetical protein [Bacteroidales bacterium]